MFVDLFLISLGVVFIVDYSLAGINLGSFLYKRITGFTGNFKLFSCSLCLTFWSSMIYLYILDVSLIKMIAFSAINAYTTSFILEIMYTIKDIFFKLIKKL